MNYFEIIGAGLSLVYVIMAGKQNIWCWSAAIASSVIYCYVFYSAALYAEALLQIFFIISSVTGVYWWAQVREGECGVELTAPRVQSCSIKFHLAFIFVNLLFGLVLGYILASYTSQKLPFADALITVFSIGTTLLVGRKILENWLYWIVIDAVCTVVYIVRGLPLTAVLYTLYVLLAFYGYKTWIKEGAYESHSHE